MNIIAEEWRWHWGFFLMPGIAIANTCIEQYGSVITWSVFPIIFTKGTPQLVMSHVRLNSDWYSVSIIAVMCAMSCYKGPRCHGIRFGIYVSLCVHFVTFLRSVLEISFSLCKVCCYLCRDVTIQYLPRCMLTVILYCGSVPHKFTLVLSAHLIDDVTSLTLFQYNWRNNTLTEKVL